MKRTDAIQQTKEENDKIKAEIEILDKEYTELKAICEEGQKALDIINEVRILSSKIKLTAEFKFM